LPFLLVLLFVFGTLGLLLKLGRELELLILGLLLLLLFLITGLLLLIRGLLLFQLLLGGLLTITGLLLLTSGFEFGSTRGLLALRIIMFSIGDAVFGLYVRPSDVLTFESNNILDLLELELNRGDLFEDLRPYTFPKY
jgi:hypothetical protein